jgi:integrase/recombinase XerD
MKSPVQMYLRVRLPDGTYPYLRAAYASNGHIRPNHAMHKGRAANFPGSTYYLRYQIKGKRVWEPAGDESSLALVALQRKALALQDAEEPDSAPTPTDAAPPPVSSFKRLLTDCASEYIAETAEHKSVKTLAAYKLTVTAFCGGVKKEHIEDITREDILIYSAALRKKGCSPRTIRNRIDHLQIFFHRFKIPSLLTGNDLPKYTDKKVRAYNPLELGKLFGHATSDESDLLHFLLCTGAREQEAQFVCWSDVDLERQTYTVTEHLDLGYRPKDKEEGTLPIPELLVETLKVRRRRYPHTRLIFPGKHGKPNGHALRTIKRLALRAGVNCGQCVNKARKSCATHPVCRHILLHKMRKTFASTLHHKGLPAQTLQRYLRHSELSTTLAYIADQPDDQVRDTINLTFSGFARAGGAT